MSDSPSQKPIVCQSCKHYYVTWEQSFPHGCKAYGMKSKDVPSKLVYLSTSELCQSFELKEKPQRPSTSR